MFYVTEMAHVKIKDYVKEKAMVFGIRIYKPRGGAQRPSLCMALDKKNDDDIVFEKNSLTFIINKKLFEQTKPIKVDFIEGEVNSGFTVISSFKKGEGLSKEQPCH
jgi:Fe-S cluster assembly iron-binding protein IscA